MLWRRRGCWRWGMTMSSVSSLPLTALRFLNTQDSAAAGSAAAADSIAALASAFCSCL